MQNIKKYCALRDVKPTVACRESGVGTSFINNIEKGSAPSVEKVQLLASYLGVTTSELLGEKKEPTPAFEDGADEISQRYTPLIKGLTPNQRKLLFVQLEAWTVQNQKPTTIKLSVAAQGDSDIETEMDLDPGFKLPSSVQAVPDEYKGKTDGKPSAPEEK